MVIPLRDLLADDAQQQALQQRIQGGLLHAREHIFFIRAIVVLPLIFL